MTRLKDDLREFEGEAEKLRRQISSESQGTGIVYLLNGHCTFVGDQREHLFIEDFYGLEKHQQRNGTIQLLHAHIQFAFALLLSQPNAKLVITGGYTRQKHPVSEFESYLQLAKLLGFEVDSPSLADRIFREDAARDSWENVCFGAAIAITEQKDTNCLHAIGYEFKRDRITAHAESVGIPEWTPTLNTLGFLYTGVNNPVNVQNALEGERRAVAEFDEEHHGMTEGQILKRHRRMTIWSQLPPVETTRHPGIDDALAINRRSWPEENSTTGTIG